jgi:hypothetical protein
MAEGPVVSVARTRRLPSRGFVPHRGASLLGAIGLHVRGELVRLAKEAAAAAMLRSLALVVHGGARGLVAAEEKAT